jgi:prophage regulatory protein
LSKILRRKSVLELTGLSKTTMYSEIEAGNFPKPVQLTARSVGWKESDIDEWVRSRLPVGKNSYNK